MPGKVHPSAVDAELDADWGDGPRLALPDGTAPGCELQDAASLLDADIPPMAFVVDGLLPLGGSSLWAGAPKAGKTQNACQAAIAVAHGEEVYGRATMGGSVVVLAFEDHLAGYRERMIKLGMGRETPLYSHVGPAPAGPALGWLDAIVDRYRPVLVVIDTLARLVRVADFNDYAAATAALEPFANLARERRFHAMFIHHARKGGGEHGEQALGSSAWAGGVDSVVDLRRDANGERFIESQNRYGEPIEATSIDFDPATGRSTLARHTRANAKAAGIEQSIIDWLADQAEPQTLSAIRGADCIVASASAIGAAVRRLAQSGMVVTHGTGARPKYTVPNRSASVPGSVLPFSPTGREKR